MTKNGDRDYYSPRFKGLFRQGLKGLGLIKLSSEKYSTDRGGQSFLYHCLRCDRNVKKGTLTIHFRMIHKELFETISRLLVIWGLVESTEPVELEEIEMENPIEIGMNL